jgi:hypothetical protein
MSSVNIGEVFIIGVEVVPENAILSALESPPKSLEKSLVFLKQLKKL